MTNCVECGSELKVMVWNSACDVEICRNAGCLLHDRPVNVLLTPKGKESQWERELKRYNLSLKNREKYERRKARKGV